jgi:hypothetical protein
MQYDRGDLYTCYLSGRVALQSRAPYLDSASLNFGSIVTGPARSEAGVLHNRLMLATV